MFAKIRNVLSEIARSSVDAKEAVRLSTTAAGEAAMGRLLLEDFADRSLMLQGVVAARSLASRQRIHDLSQVEFRVYSQWGEDGIIEWLVERLPAVAPRFVEFGVETFREANCRFLMRHRGWKGLVLDGDEANMASLRAQPYFWMHDLTAKTAFVTAENINDLLAETGFSGELGVLSIDVDGNDYWIWKAISVVNPAIVICEVNPVLGDVAPITIPYSPDFARFAAHPSGLYFGASIAALCSLADEKGYRFVGTGSSGVNAFFARSDLAGSVLDLIEEPRAFPAMHRDSRGADGKLDFVGGLDRAAVISDCEVIDVSSGHRLPLREVPQLYSCAWRERMR